MDLELGEYRENESKEKQIAFHHSGEDICVIFNERRTYHMRKDLNADYLAGYCYKQEQQRRKCRCQSFPDRHDQSPYNQKLFLLQLSPAKERVF